MSVRRHYLTYLRQRRLPLTTAVAPRLSKAELVEEESTPYYSPDRFYPVKIGDVLSERYQVAPKLGYGSASTVWLARDLWRFRWQIARMVAIKVMSGRDKSRRDNAANELTLLKRISTANKQHRGWHFVRQLVDDFTIDGTNSKHLCYVFEPLREPMWIQARRWRDGGVPAPILKVYLQMILHGLDYLHSECHIVHTDLKPDNLMMRAEDPSLFERVARDEYEDPVAQKHIGDRILYLSRNDFGPPSKTLAHVEIVDFDLSVTGSELKFGPVGAEFYRSPEVILDAGYSFPTDIWTLGVILWDIMEQRLLFDVRDEHDPQSSDEGLHLAHMTALLGPRPKPLPIGRRGSMFYDADGNLLQQDRVPADLSFESSVGKIQGKEKEMFIRFVKRMITWRPEDRSTAKELLDDPWLHEDFPED